MKQKGFTFIELLAIITIMGIILLISVPNITKQLKQNSSNEYNQFTSDLFLATESYITSYMDAFGLNEVGESKKISIERLVKNGYVKSTTINPKTNEKINLNAYVLVTLNENKTYHYTYVDDTMVICVLYENLAPEISEYAKGVVYKCDPGDGKNRFFYVLNENTDTVDLIMEKNIGKNVLATNAQSYLDDVTKKWSNVNVSLPDASKIANALNVDNWSFDSSESNNLPAWLHVNLSCKINSCTEKISGGKNENTTYGYWTNASSADLAWKIEYNNNVSSFSTASIQEEDKYGIRPVITVFKSNIETKG